MQEGETEMGRRVGVIFDNRRRLKHDATSESFVGV